MFLNPALYQRAQAETPLEGLGDEISECLSSKRFVLDATAGLAIGTVQLLDEQGAPAVLPVGSVVKKVLLDVVTSFAGAGASVALQAAAAQDLLATTAVGGLAAGLVDGKPDGTAAKCVKIATGSQLLQRRTFSVAAQPIQAVVSGGALTNGKVYVHVDFARSALS